MLAEKSLEAVCDARDVSRVLDLGSRAGEHAKRLRAAGKKVTAISLEEGDYLTKRYRKKFDAILCSHVLEHQRNPGLFLDKVYRDLREGGLLSITVPPVKNGLIGGHYTVWTLDTLVYQLVLAGFDCSRADCFRQGYNLSVVVRKVPADLPEGLPRSKKEIPLLYHLFPGGGEHGKPVLSRVLPVEC